MISNFTAVYLARRPGACILMSGIGLGLSYPPIPLSFLAWFALVPVLIRWRALSSSRQFFLEIYATLLLALSITFSWPVLHALPMTAVVSAVGIFVLPVLMSLPFVIAHVLRRSLGVIAGFLSIIVFYLAYEHLITHGPVAFPWLQLGHTQAESLAFIQYAEYTGVAGVSLWILGLNVMATVALTGSRVWIRLLTVVVYLGLSISPLYYSHIRVPSINMATVEIPIGVVQPAMGAREWANIRSGDRVDRLVSLSDSLVAAMENRPVLMIWPETALPVLSRERDKQALHERLTRWSESNRVPLLTGAITVLEASDGFAASRYQNSAYLFQPGIEMGAYHKNHLVPFAETVPMIDMLPALAMFAVPAGGVSGYVPGEETDPFHAGDLRFGTLICFESLFGDYARRYVRKGANLLIVLSQDGWWGNSFGFRQHLAFNRFRAVETRRPVAQATVSGASAFVTPSGRVIAERDWMEQSAFAVHLTIVDEPPTFYVRHGDFLGILAVIFSVVLLVIYFVSGLFTRNFPPPARKSRGLPPVRINI